MNRRGLATGAASAVSAWLVLGLMTAPLAAEAQQLGLPIPPAVLARAAHVIE